MLQKKHWFQIPLFLTLLGSAFLVMTLSASYLYLGPSLPVATELKSVSLQTPLRIYSEDGLLIGEFGEQRRIPVDFEEIPPTYIQALLSAEDDGFFEHGGVEFKSLARAMVELLRYRQIRSGGSTITMQVARNFFLSRDQTFLRKFNEIILAMQIESLLTKEEILTLYVNKIYLGHRAYGIAAAAQVYYGKELSELTLPEAAMLAGLPKAPSAYNPISNPERATQRRNWILGRMAHLGYISNEQLAAAVEEEDTAKHQLSQVLNGGEYVAEMARQFAINQFGEDAYTLGLHVYTSLDSKAQKAAMESLRLQLHDYDERHGWRGAITQYDISQLPDPGALPPRQQRLEAAAEEELATSPSDQALAQQARKQWQQALKKLTTVANLEPVVVTQVAERQAEVVFRNGTRSKLHWEHLRWARPYKGLNSLGAAPTTAKDIISVGDLVYVRPIFTEEKSTQWRLAQIPQAQSAVVAVEPKTGSIKALQGGYSFSHSKYNRALQAERQPGSAFKPFIYSSAMKHGATPGTIINDAPLVFQEEGSDLAWRPTGDSKQFYGPTRVREALYRSLNLVSIRLLLQSGIDNTLQDLAAFGFRIERFPRELALALGSGSVTPLEMAAAYSVFANGGFYIPPNFINTIHDNSGKVLWQKPLLVFCDDETDCAEKEQDAYGNLLAENVLNDLEDADLLPTVQTVRRSIDERNAWLMDSMLKDVITRGTGRSALSLKRNDIAGKTGSTNKHVDAWFVGYAPALSAAVWVGFDTPTSLGFGEYGGRVALPAWIHFMGKALADVPETTLPRPSGISTVRINPKTGLRARAGSSGSVYEHFPSERVPELEDEEYRDPYSSEEQQSLEDLF